MAENSKISWTDHTFNPWWGCFKVSDGCKNCYAETLSNRYGKSIWGPPANTDREYKKGVWKELPKWNKQARQDGVRRRVFVSSMADFFEDHPQVTEWRQDALLLMSQCEYLDFQILTKRPGNIVPMMSERYFAQGIPSNFWIGTSVENQEQAYKRIPHLLRVPAAVRFLSCEPLLGPVSLDDVFPGGMPCPVDGPYTRAIHWVIAGAESGHGARPMDLNWVRSLRDQCQAAGVPFFFKQMIVNGKKVELPELDGKVWAEMPVVED